MPARPPGAMYNDKQYPECGVATPATTPELAPQDEAIDARWMNEPTSYVVARMERDSLGDVDGYEPIPASILSLMGVGISSAVVVACPNKALKIMGGALAVLFGYSFIAGLNK